MVRRAAIIATMALASLAAPTVGWSGPAFKAYNVKLEVARNGVPVCALDRSIRAGESQQVPALPNQATSLRVLQRVTSFPGSQGRRALLEIQVFRDAGGRSSLVVAPTMGLELGEPQTYEVATQQGTVRIRATVTGDASAPGDEPDGEGLPFELMPREPGPV